ncbi:hypothetical protein B0H21DRAFT_823826 [Amylocystis lapponica]|nr:hypothetical protein B0H21DRAFT_823826 [Amylocystis lapponica]
MIFRSPPANPLLMQSALKQYSFPENSEMVFENASSTSSAHSSSSGEDDGCIARPRKRQKTIGSRYTEHSGPSYQQVVLEELDLEIALRQRLSETVQSRITWALLLQESLEKGLQVNSAGSSDFQTAALNALDAIEAPCSILLNREVILPLKPILHLPKHPAVPPQFAEPPQYGPRLGLGSSRTRGLPRPPPQPIKKLLFLRNTNTTPATIAKLACQDCARTDFSNLQGLLNHCRLRHHREYGSHDECMQSCAVLVPDQEREWVVANGTEVGGISLPSLRRLFEIAVGAGEQVVIPGVPGVAAPEQPSGSELSNVEGARESVSGSSHITRTLGHHIDTPALAPFLGRAPKQRRVNVHGDAAVVDIFTLPEEQVERKRRWRMPYNHRNIARPALDEIVSPVPISKPTENEGHDPVPADDTLSGSLQPPSALQSVTSSRFHIVARVKITDHSLWLHPERRLEPKQHHTHRWRLSSLPITTFLSKLVITCLTEPPPSTLVDPIVVTDPPFVVTSTAEKSFLARLTFVWVGSANPPIDVEHWLDPAHLTHPVVGDEQVFDVELDRNTELVPARADVYTVTWDDERSQASPRHKAAAVGNPHQRDGNISEPDYATKLRTLLPRVPMTLRDVNVKARSSIRVPYFLASTPAQFRRLVAGRRKAIEVGTSIPLRQGTEVHKEGVQQMGRARALQGLYEQLCTAPPKEEDHVPLTMADVYRWMLDEGLFPRAASATEQKVARKGSSSPMPGAAPAPVSGQEYCSTCGAHQSVHSIGVTVKDESADGKVTPAPTSMVVVGAGLSACVAFKTTEEVRMPLFDVHRLLTPSNAHGPSSYTLHATLSAVPPTSYAGLHHIPSSADLVSIADPHLTTAICALTLKWKLEHVSAQPASLTELSRPREEIVDRLAPHALLAVLTKSFLRVLLHRGVDAFRRDEAAARMLSRYERPRHKGRDATGPLRLLTPAHVVRGLASHAPHARQDAATLLALSRLGESSQDARPLLLGEVSTDRAPAGHAQPGSTSQVGGVAVKTEVEEALT